MKIAIVSSGSSIHVKKIANTLVERGNEITLYTLPNHVKLFGEFDPRIKIVKLLFPSPYGYYLNAMILRKKLIKGKYDLINTHYASGYGTLARLTNVHPLVMAIFGSDVYEYPYQSKHNMKNLIKNLDAADGITSTSNVMKKEVKKYYHSDKEIYVTPFGVDLKKFCPVDVTKDNVFEFGIVKKIEPKYGIDLLIYAFDKILCKYPSQQFRLVIYGRGSSVEEYKNLSQKLGIADYVLFKGFVKNELVPEVLSHMDVACFPSVVDSESFGVAAVEAMACGVPVIVSDASGFTEVVENMKTGIIVPKMDSQALFEAMDSMYQMSITQRVAMGKAGIERANQLYNFEKNMDEYVFAIMHAVKK